MQEISGCQGYPPSHYDLLLRDVGANESYAIVDSSVVPSFTISSPLIKENAVYDYKVRAVNTFNISKETEERTFCKFLNFC